MTIGGVLTPASAPALRMRPNVHRCHPAIAFVTVTASSRRRFSAVFITNTGSNRELREHAELAASLFAHHTGASASSCPDSGNHLFQIVIQLLRIVEMCSRWENTAYFCAGILTCANSAGSSEKSDTSTPHK